MQCEDFIQRSRCPRFHHRADVDHILRDWLHSAVTTLKEIKIHCRGGIALAKMRFRSESFRLRLVDLVSTQVRPATGRVHHRLCFETLVCGFHTKCWSGYDPSHLGLLSAYDSTRY